MRACLAANKVLAYACVTVGLTVYMCARVYAYFDWRHFLFALN